MDTTNLNNDTYANEINFDEKFEKQLKAMMLKMQNSHFDSSTTTLVEQSPQKVFDRTIPSIKSNFITLLDTNKAIDILHGCQIIPHLGEINVLSSFIFPTRVDVDDIHCQKITLIVGNTKQKLDLIDLQVPRPIIYKIKNNRKARKYGYNKVIISRIPLTQGYYSFEVKTYKYMSKDYSSDDEARPQVNFDVSGLFNSFTGLDKVTDLAEDISDVIPDIKSTINRFVDVLKNFETTSKPESLSRIFDPLNNTLTKAISRAEEASNSLSSGLAKIVIVAAMIFHLSCRTNVSLCTLVSVGSYVLFSNFQDIKTFVFSAFQKLVSVFSGATPQASGAATLSSTIITILISIFFSGYSDVASLSGKILKVLGDFNKYSTSFEGIINFVVSTLVKALKFISMDNYLPDSFKHFGVDMTAVKTYATNLELIFEEINSKVFVVSRINYERLKKLKREGEDICRALRTNSSDFIFLNKHLTTLTAIMSKFEKKINLCDNTQEPRMYRIAGNTGMFKSQMLQHLSVDLVVRSSSDSEILAYNNKPMLGVYNMSESTGYADGYTMDKKVILIDDAGQIVTLPGDLDSTDMKLFQIISELPSMTHQADLADKGNIVWNSPFILASTNIPVVKSNQVNFLEALQRRNYRSFYMVHKSEYLIDANVPHPMQSKLNVSSLPLGPLGESDSSPDHALFFPYDCCTGDIIGRPLNYEELVNIILDDYDQSKKWFAQKLVQLEDRRLKAEIIRQERVKHNLNIDVTSHLSEYLDALDISDDSSVDSKNSTLNDMNPSEAVPQSVASKLRQKHINLTPIADLTSDDMPDIDIVHGKSDKFIMEYIVEMAETFRLLEMSHIFDNTATMSAEMIKFDQFCRLSRLIPLIGEHILTTRWQIYADTYGNEFWDILENDKSYTDDEFIEMLVNLGIDRLEFNIPFVNITWKEKVKYKLSLFGQIMYEFMASHARFALPIIFCVGWGVTYTILRFTCKTISNFVWNFLYGSEAIPESSGSAARHKSGNQSRKFVQDYTNVRAQMGYKTDFNGMERTDKIINKNQYSVCFVNIDNKLVHRIYAVMIKGHAGIVSYHFVTLMKKEIETKEISNDFVMYFVKQDQDGNRRDPHKITVKEFLSNIITTPESIARDLCLFQIPNRFPTHMDVSNSFVNRADLVSLFGKPIDVRVANQHQPGVGKQSDFTIAKTVTNVPYSHHSSEGFMYQIPTQDGDCMSIGHILSTDKKYCGKIAFFHTAIQKNGKAAFGTWAPQEMILDLLDKALPQISELFDDEIIPQSTSFKYGKPIEFVMKLPSVSPTSTSIVPSLIPNVFGKPIEIPAWLRPFTHNNEIIDPRSLSQKNYSPISPLFNEETIRHVVKAVFRDLESNSSFNVPRYSVDLESAISGIEGEKFFDRINMSTSPGYKYIHNTIKGGKKDFFGLDGEERNSDHYKSLVNDVDNIIDSAKDGKRLLHIYADHLKDETRPIDKVLIGKTRNFSSMPLDLNLVFRQKYGRFIQWCMLNHTSNGMAIGINPYSSDWDILHKRQTSISGGKNVMAGDFSSFDKLQYQTILNIILDEINNWFEYDHEDAKIRDILKYEVMNSRHIIDYDVLEWVGSLPSGNTMTTILNSLYNLYAHYHAFLIANDNNLMSLLDFNNKVKIMVYGDDSHVEVSDDCAEIYNEMKMPGLMAQLGLKYTIETKSGVALKPFRDISETNFLKRTFSFNKYLNKIVAPLELSVILHMADYSFKGLEYENGTRNTVDIQLKELTLHGEEIFNEYCFRLIHASRDYLNHEPVSTEYLMLLKLTTATISFF